MERLAGGEEGFATARTGHALGIVEAESEGSAVTERPAEDG